VIRAVLEPPERARARTPVRNKILISMPASSRGRQKKGNNDRSHPRPDSAETARVRSPRKFTTKRAHTLVPAPIGEKINSPGLQPYDRGSCKKEKVSAQKEREEREKITRSRWTSYSSSLGSLGLPSPPLALSPRVAFCPHENGGGACNRISMTIR
jgi:hypothetical protein